MKGQIEKRGDTVYRLRWYRGRVDGKRIYGSKTVRGNRRQAEEQLRKILSRQDDGHAVPSRVPTLAEFLEAWKTGEAAAALRPRTLRVYLDLLKRHVTPKLGTVSLRSLHSTRIEREVVAPLRAAGHVRTAQLAVAALSKVMRAAAKDPTLGLAGNPCHGVEVGGVEARSVQPMTSEERERFCAALRGTSHEVLFLLLMGTGLRPGEALALCWEHVELEAGEVRVERTVDDRGTFHPPKTEKGRRVVPLPASLRRALAELHLGLGRPAEGLVFRNAKGRTLSQRNLLRRHFRPAIAAAKIERVLRVYDLRHGYATAALESGADVRTTADLMGHSSTRLTLDTYSHVTDERKRETVRRIAAALDLG